MNKAELIDAVQTALGQDCSMAQAERSVNAVLDCIRDSLAGGDKVQIVGFGTFDVRERKARTGRNPQTGETIQIQASRTVGFRPGAALKGAV